MHAFIPPARRSEGQFQGRTTLRPCCQVRDQWLRPESGRRGRLHPTTILGARPEPGASRAIALHSARGHVPGTAVQMQRDQRWGSPPAGIAHPSSQGTAPSPALTEDQDVLARRQLGPGARGHLAQDRRPGGREGQCTAGGRPDPAASPEGLPGVSRPTPDHPRPARPPQRRTKGSGPLPPRSLGRRRPPPRARSGPAAASSPPPPAPSCQLQPQRGPGLPRGPARTREDPGGAARRAPAAASRCASRCKPRRVRATASPRRAALPFRCLCVLRRLPAATEGKREVEAVRRPLGQPCARKRQRQRQWEPWARKALSGVPCRSNGALAAAVATPPEFPGPGSPKRSPGRRQPDEG